MSDDIESDKLREKIDKHHLGFLSNETLEQDQRFIYLKSQLQNFFKTLYLTQNYSTNPQKTSEWNKNLHNSLYSLLGEISLTSNASKQSMLLDKAYKWYRNCLTSTPSEKLLPKASIQSQKKVSLPSIEVPPTHKVSPKSSSPLYFPRQHKVNIKDNIVNNTESSYFKMLESERIDFMVKKHEGKLDNYRPKSPVIVVEDQDMEVSEEIYKKNSMTPENVVDCFRCDGFSTPSFDFRNNYRYRNIGNVDKNRFFERIKYKDMKKIDIVKGKLAKNRIIVDSKLLEIALKSHEAYESSNNELKKLPMGGEMLMKLKKSKYKIFSRKYSKNKKKDSKPLITD